MWYRILTRVVTNIKLISCRLFHSYYYYYKEQLSTHESSIADAPFHGSKDPCSKYGPTRPAVGCTLVGVKVQAVRLYPFIAHLLPKHGFFAARFQWLSPLLALSLVTPFLKRHPPQGKTVTAVGWTSLLEHPAWFCRQLAQGYAYAGTPRDRQKEHGTL